MRVKNVLMIDFFSLEFNFFLQSFIHSFIYSLVQSIKRVGKSLFKNEEKKMFIRKQNYLIIATLYIELQVLNKG